MACLPYSSAFLYRIFTVEIKAKIYSTLGPVLILFEKKKVRSRDGKMTKRIFIKSNDKHCIWVHWSQGAGDSEISYWSAESQGFASILSLVFRLILEYLRKAGLGDQVDACLKRKVIWPYPSKDPGSSFTPCGFPDLSEQIHLCRQRNFKAWCHQSLVFEKQYKWEVHNGETLSELSHPEGRKKLKLYINEEKVSNWFLETFIQVEGLCFHFTTVCLTPLRQTATFSMRQNDKDSIRED